jgi:isopentenyl-diphosphate Delta-isomerase
VRVEQLRASGQEAEVGETFSGWGIPTAAAIASVRARVPAHVRLVASGGLRNGLEVAKVLALGADLGGVALPLFRAQQEGGRAKASSRMATLLAELRQACLLTGSRTVTELREKPRVVTGQLKDWLAALVP